MREDEILRRKRELLVEMRDKAIRDNDLLSYMRSEDKIKEIDNKLNSK
jgi:hypothetical protein